jgi:dihydrofolate reductase
VLALVVAHAANRVIGRDGELPWRLPSDMKRFRELTVGHAVVMGRCTFQSLPAAFSPLPERRNLVLSGNPSYAPEGVEVFAGLDTALEACGGGECFVIGGERAYREALPLAGRLYATEIDSEVEGDAFFPEIDAGQWHRSERSERLVEDGLGYTFNTYERFRPSL